MSLDLVTIAADVEAIAEKATKEASQENSLMVLQTTWDSIEFSVTTSTETDTPLISMSEEDLEVTGKFRNVQVGDLELQNPSVGSISRYQSCKSSRN